MSLLDQLKAKQEQPKAQVQEEPETVETEVEVDEETGEVVEETEEVNETSNETPEPETESAEDKLRRRRDRELFQDEVKEGKWNEYQEAVKELKTYAESNKLNYLKMISGVNLKFRKTSSATSTYVRKQKEMNADEKEFDALKTQFDTTVSDAIQLFQNGIDALAAKLNYKPEEGKSPVVQRTAYIENGREFKDFLSEQK